MYSRENESVKAAHVRGDEDSEGLARTVLASQEPFVSATTVTSDSTAVDVGDSEFTAEGTTSSAAESVPDIATSVRYVSRCREAESEVESNNRTEIDRPIGNVNK